MTLLWSTVFFSTKLNWRMSKPAIGYQSRNLFMVAGRRAFVAGNREAFMNCRRLVSMMALVALVTSVVSYAQDAPQLETIPQTLARGGESLTSRPTIPSGTVSMTLAL